MLTDVKIDDGWKRPKSFIYSCDYPESCNNRYLTIYDTVKKVSNTRVSIPEILDYCNYILGVVPVYPNQIAFIPVDKDDLGYMETWKSPQCVGSYACNSNSTYIKTEKGDIIYKLHINIMPLECTSTFWYGSNGKLWTKVYLYKNFVSCPYPITKDTNVYIVNKDSTLYQLCINDEVVRYITKCKLFKR